MNTPYGTTTAGAQSPKPNANRSTMQSTWWKRGEHLITRTPTGTHYVRMEIEGKTIRASLGTTDLATTRLLLPVKLAEIRTPKKPKVEAETFADGRAKFDQATDTRSDLAETSRVYRHRCVDCQAIVLCS